MPVGAGWTNPWTWGLGLSRSTVFLKRPFPSGVRGADGLERRFLIQVPGIETRR